MAVNQVFRLPLIKLSFISRLIFSAREFKPFFLHQPGLEEWECHFLILFLESSSVPGTIQVLRNCYYIIYFPLHRLCACKISSLSLHACLPFLISLG